MPELAVEWFLDRGDGPEPQGENHCMIQGFQNLLDVVFGLGGTLLSTGNLRVAVGDDPTSPNSNALTRLRSETNATNSFRVVASNPVFAGQNQIVARAAFTSAQANFAWNEWGLAWGVGNTDTLMTRQVPANPPGAKPSGVTWVLLAAVSIT